MGYQIYVKEVLPDGPCDPEKEIRFDHGCISGWDLDSVPGVSAFGVDGHNALDTAHEELTVRKNGGPIIALHCG